MEIGKKYKLIEDKEYQAKHYNVLNGEEVVSNTGVLEKFYEKTGICVLSVKIKYHYNDGIIKDTNIYVNKDDLTLIN
ncbi:MAG: hypothetical protein U0T69_11440 [Chitinophagales bacterium]